MIEKNWKRLKRCENILCNKKFVITHELQRYCPDCRQANKQRLMQDTRTRNKKLKRSRAAV